MEEGDAQGNPETEHFEMKTATFALLALAAFSGQCQSRHLHDPTLEAVRREVNRVAQLLPAVDEAEDIAEEVQREENEVTTVHIIK